MLDFRDWLRANDAERKLYENAKRELAGRDWKYVQNYADAKIAVRTGVRSSSFHSPRWKRGHVFLVHDRRDLSLEVARATTRPRAPRGEAHGWNVEDLTPLLKMGSKPSSARSTLLMWP